MEPNLPRPCLCLTTVQLIKSAVMQSVYIVRGQVVCPQGTQKKKLSETVSMAGHMVLVDSSVLFCFEHPATSSSWRLKVEALFCAWYGQILYVERRIFRQQIIKIRQLLPDWSEYYRSVKKNSQQGKRNLPVLVLCQPSSLYNVKETRLEHCVICILFHPQPHLPCCTVCKVDKSTCLKNGVPFFQPGESPELAWFQIR